MQNLENSELKIAVKAHGAELCSVLRKKDQKEYIWQADLQYWKRHAPTLFPIVGSLSDKRNISMGRHGFARDNEFKLIEKTTSKLVMELRSNTSTMEVYPYVFTLRMTYVLEKNTVDIVYDVINEGAAVMPFSIGAHPAFNCNLEGGQVSLEFEKEENLSRLSLDLELGLLNGSVQAMALENRKMLLSEELFSEDALVFKGLQSNWIKISDRSTNTDLKVHFSGFPYMGIWSPKAPFVCIEPWYGVTDSVGDKGPLTEKAGIITLEAGEQFNAIHSIEIL